jgi:PKD repeat protein
LTAKSPREPRFSKVFSCLPRNEVYNNEENSFGTHDGFFIDFVSSSVYCNAQIVHATPSFVYSPLTPRVGDVVSFDALWWEQYWNENNDPRTFSYSWNFGDGTFTTGVTVNHTYTKPGTYAVGVTVDDNLGTGGMSEMEIDVRERTPVTVHISLSSDSVYTGEEVTISGNLTYDDIRRTKMFAFFFRARLTLRTPCGMK